MATTADFKNGLFIEFNGKIYTIVQFQHVKPGKGGAFVRTKLKSLETGKVVENTFTAGVKINVVRVERRPYQFLYKDDLGYHFMHQDTFEQVSIQEHMIENADLLKEGQYVEMMVEAEKENILTCELLPFVEMEVTYTEPGLKGDTASSTALKPATVETGAVINVPLFVNTGDKIKVDTRTREYVERVK
ncbi:MAG TPA: elongation factor P [Bacteroidales bacterium]|nr:elongation factor P [Bacteroidales bacterium]